MNIKNKIGLLIISTIMLISSLHAQVIDTVCAGDKGVMYSVNRSPFLYNTTFVWTVNGGRFTNVSSNGDTILVDWGHSNGAFKIQVFEITDNDCEGDVMEAEVEVFASPDVDLGTNEEYCFGEYIDFSLPSGYASYLWSNGSTSRKYTANNDSSEIIWAKVENEFGCTVIDSVNLIVHPSPTLNIGNDTILCGTEEVTLDAGDFSYYSWSTGDISRDITIGEGGKVIWLEVEDENGCITSDTLLVSRCNIDELFNNISNAFTPNNDGENDVWKIDNIQYFPKTKISIFDRWGRLVYECDGCGFDYNEVWDGRNMRGKAMPMAAYYYVIDLNYEDAKPITGNVTIIR